MLMKWFTKIRVLCVKLGPEVKGTDDVGTPSQELHQTAVHYVL